MNRYVYLRDDSPMNTMVKRCHGFAVENGTTYVVCRASKVKYTIRP